MKLPSYSIENKLSRISIFYIIYLFKFFDSFWLSQKTYHMRKNSWVKSLLKAKVKISAEEIRKIF